MPAAIKSNAGKERSRRKKYAFPLFWWIPFFTAFWSLGSFHFNLYRKRIRITRLPRIHTIARRRLRFQSTINHVSDESSDDRTLLIRIAMLFLSLIYAIYSNHRDPYVYMLELFFISLEKDLCLYPKDRLRQDSRKKALIQPRLDEFVRYVNVKKRGDERFCGFLISTLLRPQTPINMTREFWTLLIFISFRVV